MAAGPSSSSHLHLDLSKVEYYSGNLSPRTPSARDTVARTGLTSSSQDPAPASSSGARITRTRVYGSSKGKSTALKIALKSIGTGEACSSSGQISVNPLWQLSKSRKLKSLETITLNKVTGDNEIQFNKALCTFIQATMADCSIPIPNKIMLQFEVRKYLRQEAENILFKTGSLTRSHEESYEEVITKTINDLISCGALVNYVHKRLELMYDCVIRLQKKSKFISSYSKSLESKLSFLLGWRLIKSYEDHVSYKSVKLYLKTVQNTSKKSSFLIETIFKSTESFNEFRKYLDDLYKNPKCLEPELKIILEMRSRIALCPSTFDDNPWHQSAGHRLSLGLIPPNSIIRTLIPSKTPLIEDIIINGERIQLTLPDDPETNIHELYFYSLVKELLIRSSEPFDETALISEIKFVFGSAGVDWNYAKTVWCEEITTAEKLQKVKPVLSHPKIDWNRLEKMSPLPESFEEFIKCYYSNSVCTIPWLNVLRLTTIDCFGHGDSYSRQLFPKIYAVPFTTKSEPGIRLEINYVNKDTYSVTQIRKFAIYLRRQPSSPKCFKESEKPLAFVSQSWYVSPSKDLDVEDADYTGSLKIRDLTFTDHITLDEKEAILISLHKL